MVLGLGFGFLDYGEGRQGEKRLGESEKEPMKILVEFWL
jgi:hypothetical protein